MNYDPPPAPDYGKSTAEAVAADVSALPLRKLIENAAKMGSKIQYTDPSDGTTKTADFTGNGDVDQAKAMQAFGIESADKNAGAQLDLAKKYGSEFIAQRTKELKESDPTGYAIRQKLGDKALSDLDKGSQLDDSQLRQVTQAERAAQVSRGNLLGNSSAAAEAMQTGDAGFRLGQQRLANAGAFLAGSTPMAQFGSLAGAQGGVTPFNPMGVQQGYSQNAGAGAQGLMFAQANYNQLSSNANMKAQLDPWNKFVGSFASEAGNMLGGGLAESAASKL